MTTSQADSILPAARRDSFPFMDLPPEIRLMIYGHLFDSSAEQKPNHPLLATSKSIESEASPVLGRKFYLFIHVYHIPRSGISMFFERHYTDRLLHWTKPVLRISGNTCDQTNTDWSDFLHKKLAGSVFGNMNEIRIYVLASPSFYIQLQRDKVTVRIIHWDPTRINDVADEMTATITSLMRTHDTRARFNLVFLDALVTELINSGNHEKISRVLTPA